MNSRARAQGLGFRFGFRVWGLGLSQGFGAEGLRILPGIDLDEAGPQHFDFGADFMIPRAYKECSKFF